jgi:hypothetical protein
MKKTFNCYTSLTSYEGFAQVLAFVITGRNSRKLDNAPLENIRALLDDIELGYGTTIWIVCGAIFTQNVTPSPLDIA